MAAKRLRLYAQGVTHRNERKRPSFVRGEQPLFGFAKKPAPRNLTRRLKALKDINSVGEDRQHKTLFAAQGAATTQCIELAWQQNVRFEPKRLSVRARTANCGFRFTLVSGSSVIDALHIRAAALKTLLDSEEYRTRPSVSLVRLN
jgi:hypothetical protein